MRFSNDKRNRHEAKLRCTELYAQLVSIPNVQIDYDIEGEYTESPN